MPAQNDVYIIGIGTQGCFELRNWSDRLELRFAPSAGDPGQWVTMTHREAALVQRAITESINTKDSLDA